MGLFSSLFKKSETQETTVETPVREETIVTEEESCADSTCECTVEEAIVEVPVAEEIVETSIDETEEVLTEETPLV